MKLKAAAQWMLAILLMAPCMQAQSVWNTTHLAKVKRLLNHDSEAVTMIYALADMVQQKRKKRSK